MAGWTGWLAPGAKFAFGMREGRQAWRSIANRLTVQIGLPASASEQVAAVLVKLARRHQLQRRNLLGSVFLPTSASARFQRSVMAASEMLPDALRARWRAELADFDDVTIRERFAYCYESFVFGEREHGSVLAGQLCTPSSPGLGRPPRFRLLSMLIGLVALGSVTAALRWADDLATDNAALAAMFGLVVYAGSESVRTTANLQTLRRQLNELIDALVAPLRTRKPTRLEMGQSDSSRTADLREHLERLVGDAGTGTTRWTNGPPLERNGPLSSIVYVSEIDQQRIIDTSKDLERALVAERSDDSLTKGMPFSVSTLRTTILAMEDRWSFRGRYDAADPTDGNLYADALGACLALSVALDRLDVQVAQSDPHTAGRR